MLESLAGKVIAGIISVSALMFTSYTGNDPIFLPVQSRVSHNYLQLNVKLDNAFDNDFTDVFKCGMPIHLRYKIEIRQNKRVALTRNYTHTVSYDPMNASWKLFRSEINQTEVFTNYKELVENIAELECSIPLNDRWKIVEVRAESWLPVIKLTQSKRTIDLMVLWKFQRPKVKATLNVSQTMKG
jgi:hypothetical protein